MADTAVPAKPEPAPREPQVGQWQPPEQPQKKSEAVREIGGRKNGLEPTRYGDWEKNGRCIDF
jgi:hypothetical protein